MQRFGGAGAVLTNLLAHLPSSDFLRIDSTPVCPACCKHQREAFTFQPSFTCLDLDRRTLRAAGGDPFLALLNHINNIERNPHTTECKFCGTREQHDMVRFTSVPTHGAPRFICLELPDRDPPGSYHLCANEDRELMINEATSGKYRLVSVLLHKLGAHFIADTFDAREQCWIRFDGYSPACGLGQRVTPPQAGRVRHTHSLSGSYIPTYVIYGRVE